jgi:molybdenum cofactor sulfurtransferase
MSMSKRFENGTIDFLSFPAVINGLSFLSKVGMKKISARIKLLRTYLYHNLSSLNHSNGIPLVNLYGPQDNLNVGGTISMNVIDNCGKAYPFDVIQQKANDSKISIRSGCFCNPGIDEVMNDITPENLNWFFNLQDSDFQCSFEIKTNMFGINRGAVRVAVGIPTTISELDRFINFISSFRNMPAGQLN